jgi:hypothetical protein
LNKLDIGDGFELNVTKADFKSTKPASTRAGNNNSIINNRQQQGLLDDNSIYNLLPFDARSDPALIVLNLYDISQSEDADMMMRIEVLHTLSSSHEAL